MPLRAATSPYNSPRSSACQAGSTLDNMVLWMEGVSLEECKGSMSWEVWSLEVGVYSNGMTILEGASSFCTEDEVGPRHVSAAQGQP